MIPKCQPTIFTLASRSSFQSGALAWTFIALGLMAAPAFAADTVYYYSSDTIHSEVVVTDQNRNVVERTHYAPYGQVLDRNLRDGPGYTGHEEDPETNLVYMQQRYYDPEAGRFLSTDPVQADGGGGSFNRYEYANDNPYRYTDPFGLFKCAAGASASDCKTITSNMNGAIKLIQKAASSLSSSAKFTNRIEGGNLNKLVKFLKSDNAVVGMGGSGSSSELGSTQGDAHHPISMTIDFAGARTAIQNSAYKSNTSVEMAAVVAHEGQHGMDIFNGDGPSNVYESFHMSELRAFMTQSSVDKGLNSNSAWGLWNPSWPASSAENERYNMADQWAQYDAHYDCFRSGCQ